MKRVVLVGGGHSHLEVVRQFGERAPAQAEILLVDPAPYATYSGMVPGLIAGHYDFQACHVDLAQLAQRTRVTFVKRRVCDIDAARKTIALDNGKFIGYDIVSLDVGSTPPVASTPGAREYAIAVKPFAAFAQRWDRVLSEVQKIRNVVVVGGGAAGVELALAMQYRIRRTAAQANVSFAIVSAEECILRDHSARVRAAVERLLNERGVAVHANSKVERVEPDAVALSGSKTLASDATVWATGAAAPDWFASAEMALDAHGFLSVDETLASVSHPSVFGAGDCATIAGHVLPKSGVYAVREGPVLAENLRRAVSSEPLIRYWPQRRALALISAGAQYAIASYGAIALEGAWVWRWKDYIDRKFMRRYRD